MYFQLDVLEKRYIVDNYENKSLVYIVEVIFVFM